MRRPLRGRVLGVRFGFNPNSSSLGIDVSFLLVGLTGVLVVAAGVGAFLKGAAGHSTDPEETDPEERPDGSPDEPDQPPDLQ